MKKQQEQDSLSSPVLPANRQETKNSKQILTFITYILLKHLPLQALIVL